MPRPILSPTRKKMEAEIEDAYLLITDKKISAIADLLPFWKDLLKVSKKFSHYCRRN